MFLQHLEIHQSQGIGVGGELFIEHINGGFHEFFQDPFELCPMLFWRETVTVETEGKRQEGLPGQLVP
jgi:hypothetical protein